MTGQRSTFSEAVNRTLAEQLERDPSVVLFGEGINDPGGFFGTTVGLAERFGHDRCFDVPNSEESLAGMALGAALGGLRPVFVNLRVEFLLLAMNQVVNHLAKWPALVGHPLPLPVTIRAMVGRGWGQGAQHSGVYGPLFAHVPGLQVAIPSDPISGARLVAASVQGSMPTVLLEPKAVYDLTAVVPPGVEPAPVGRAEVVRVGEDASIVAVGDAVQTALLAADELAEQGIDVEVVDARWLAPFDVAAVRASVAKTGIVAVVDIGWSSYGLAAEVARSLLRGEVVPLRAPLLDLAPVDHAPAGCFAEADHYPTVANVSEAIADACRRAAKERR